jgi:hypothetical protein
MSLNRECISLASRPRCFKASVALLAALALGLSGCASVSLKEAGPGAVVGGVLGGVVGCAMTIYVACAPGAAWGAAIGSGTMVALTSAEKARYNDCREAGGSWKYCNELVRGK